MIKLLTAILAILSLTISPSAALTAEDFSDEARTLLPETTEVTLILKDGSSHSGELISRTKEKYTIKMDRGRGITFQKEFNLSDIKSVQQKNPEDHLAMALIGFKETLDGTPTDADLEKMERLLKEFLNKVLEHKALPAIKFLHDDAVKQLGLRSRGLQKIAGVWMPPVQASITKFDMSEKLISEMEEKFRGINGATYPANPKAKSFYDTQILARRDIARSLPQIMADRMPILLAEKRFDEAVDELNAFQTFFLTRVIGTEASARQLSPADAQLFNQMDIQYFFRMQQRIMDAFTGSYPEIKVNLDDNSPMVKIPAGFYIRGDSKASPGSDNFPALITYVDEFEIDRYEVSNAEYRKFVDYVESTGDSSMEHPDAPPLKNHRPAGWDVLELSGDDLPVVGVDWFDAYAYAKWKGKRLPTEAEWEKAARGIHPLVYPWGDQNPAEVFANNPSGRQSLANRINQARKPPPEQQRKDTVQPPPFQFAKSTWPVTVLVPEDAAVLMISPDLPGLSPYGLYHMAGNAAEWVQDVYDAKYYYNAPPRNPSGPESGDVRLFRGGSFISPDPELATHYRIAADPRNPNFKKGLAKDNTPIIGFRCAK